VTLILRIYTKSWRHCAILPRSLGYRLREDKRYCILAEKLGYYGFYYGESLAEIDLDCWSVISNLFAMTTTIKLGPVITYLIPQYRNIALLAKQSATLQEISNGRLEFRTGAGQHMITQYNGGIHSE
jgi:alkanesulfonate monooxygenase SsuD/methylene tetrahydromethanopterin reductase-like flavin-dependent oxidoreductase (luciferase family)